MAQLYVEHGFPSEDGVDTFLSDIPVLGEHDEPDFTVTDHILRYPQSDVGSLITPTFSVDLHAYTDTFTKSQLRAFRWVETTTDKCVQPLWARLVQANPTS